MSEKSETFSFLGFVPAMVVQFLKETVGKSNKKLDLPLKQNLKSVVMFADISGFTNLTETLSKKGSEGCEKIAFAINRYMELMVKEIGKSGGDIFKFAGDAMIIVWPPPTSDNIEDQNKQLTASARSGLQAALQIQQKLNNTKIMDNIKLSVKIGFGVGDFSIIYVGGIYGRSEYLPVGDPLTQAFNSESFAVGGQVVASKEIHKLIKDNFTWQEIETEDGRRTQFYQIKEVKDKVRSYADAMLITRKIGQQDLEKIKDNVLTYVPKAIQDYIKYEQEKWSSELRKLTIIFMNIGIELADAQTSQGLEKIQKVIETVQKCIYFHEGSLNKFLMDDKGSTLIIAFGLPPMTHQDDASRAVFCGFLLQQELKLLNVRCALGISSGLVFSGIVGTSGSRREYSVIGDSVNLAARIMSRACGNYKNDETTMLCCEKTVYLCQNQLSFKFYEKKLFKGKSTEMNIYQPLNYTAEQYKKEISKKNIFPTLRTHHNSFPVHKMNLQHILKKDLKNYEFMCGNQRKSQLQDFTKNVMDKFIRDKLPSGFCLIRGSFGIGKSLFLRNILLKIQEKLDSYDKSKEKPIICVSSMRNYERKNKLNAISSILKQLFQIYAQKKDQQCNRQLLAQMIPKYHQHLQKSPKNEDLSDKKYMDFIILIEQIFGIQQKDYVKEFLVQKPEYGEDALQEERQRIKKYIIQFFQTFTGQIPGTPDKTPFQTDNEEEEEEQKQQNTEYNEYHKNPPLIICIEDLQYCDIYSFKIIRMLLKKFVRVYVISTLRDDYPENPIFKDKNFVSFEEIYTEELDKIQNCFDTEQEGRYKIIDIKNLNMDESWQMIHQLFKVRRVCYMADAEEIISQEEITEKNLNIFGQQQYDDYQKSYRYLFFSKLKKELKKNPGELLINFLYLKTNGNPIRLYDMVQSFVEQKLLLIENPEEEIQEFNLNQSINLNQQQMQLLIKKQDSELNPETFYITKELKKIILMEDLLTSDTPVSSYKANGPLIDSLEFQDLLVLKVASLIGDVFDIQMLHKINPFKDLIKAERLREILFTLEQNSYLEILDQQDNNVYFRFFYPFIRESLYQRLTYEQRRKLHLLVAEAIQTLPSYEDDEDQEGEKLVYHWELAESKGKDTQEGFSHQAKRSIIVKKITNILGKSQYNKTEMILKHEQLDKKSDSNVTWAPRYTVLSNKEIRYYRNKQQFDDSKNNQPLGIILLKDIYKITPLNENAIGNKKYAFQIATSNWIKKEKVNPERKFYFAAKSEENLDQWIIYLEFAKAKAVYDQFVNSFGKISFPIGIQINIEPAFKNLLNIDKKQTEISNNQVKVSKQQARRTTRLLNIKQIQPQKQKNNRDSDHDLDVLQLQLSEFLKKGMMLFFAHIFEMSLQNDELFDKRFGITPTKFQTKNRDLFQVSQSIIQNVKQQEQQKNIDLSEEYSPKSRPSDELKSPLKLRQKTETNIRNTNLSYSPKMKDSNEIKMFNNQIQEQANVNLQPKKKKKKSSQQYDHNSSSYQNSPSLSSSSEVSQINEQQLNNLNKNQIQNNNNQFNLDNNINNSKGIMVLQSNKKLRKRSSQISQDSQLDIIGEESENGQIIKDEAQVQLSPKFIQPINLQNPGSQIKQSQANNNLSEIQEETDLSLNQSTSTIYQQQQTNTQIHQQQIYQNLNQKIEQNLPKLLSNAKNKNNNNKNNQSQTSSEYEKEQEESQKQLSIQQIQEIEEKIKKEQEKIFLQKLEDIKQRAEKQSEEDKLKLLKKIQELEQRIEEKNQKELEEKNRKIEQERKKKEEEKQRLFKIDDDPLKAFEFIPEKPNFMDSIYKAIKITGKNKTLAQKYEQQIYFQPKDLQEFSKIQNSKNFQQLIKPQQLIYPQKQQGDQFTQIFNSNILELEQSQLMKNEQQKILFQIQNQLQLDPSINLGNSLQINQNNINSHSKLTQSAYNNKFNKQQFQQNQQNFQYLQQQQLQNQQQQLNTNRTNGSNSIIPKSKNSEQFINNNQKSNEKEHFPLIQATQLNDYNMQISNPIQFQNYYNNTQSNNNNLQSSEELKAQQLVGNNIKQSQIKNKK